MVVTSDIEDMEVEPTTIPGITSEVSSSSSQELPAPQRTEPLVIQGQDRW